MNAPRILVVDDEPQILRFMRPALEAAGFEPITTETAAGALHAAAAKAPDLILLDLGLPDKDGKEVIRQVRAWSDVPIIVLSARDREAEKIAALDLGADDYVNKPFAIGELLARIRAALRHSRPVQMVAPSLSVGGITIDIEKHEVQKNGVAVHLTPKEFDLLWLLMQHHGKLLTHRQILTEIWGPAHTEDVQYLRVLIKQLRDKVEDEPGVSRRIHTEVGVGYRFDYP